MNIDKYEIIESIGKGGFGSVYLARDVHINRLVAIKKMHPGENTIREMELLKSINIKGIPHVYDFVGTNEDCYLVMEYIEGISLKDYLKEHGKVSLNRCLSIIYQLADIFAELHSMKPSIIYRDLKPENILIEPDGNIKLIDLGAALVRNYSGNEMQGAYGTRGYSAPELWLRQMATPASDVYSFGVLMIEMLTGTKISDTSGKRNSLRAYDGNIPKGIENVIRRCLMDNPKDRYRSVVELKEALSQFKDYGKKAEMLFNLRKLLVAFAYIAAIMNFLVCIGNEKVFSLDIPKMSGGLAGISIAMLIHMIFIYKDMKNKRRIEIKKEIWLTSKKYVGLYGAILAVTGMTFFMLSIKGYSGTAYAASAPESMWVEVKDDKDRKLLIMDDARYTVTESLKLEIPSESLPNKDLTIKVIAIDRDGNSYQSRDFNIDNIGNEEKCE